MSTGTASIKQEVIARWSSYTTKQKLINAFYVFCASTFLGFFDILLNGPSFSSVFSDIYQANIGFDVAYFGFFGYLLGGLLLTVLPRFFESHKNAIIAISVFVGIASIIVRYFTLGVSVSVGIACVFVAGLMLPFSKSLFFYNISLLRNVSVLVLCASLGQVGKIILETAISVLPDTMQLGLLGVAAVICTVMLLCLFRLQPLVSFADTSSALIKRDMTWSYLIGQMVVITLITALFRAFTTFNCFPQDASGIALEAVLYFLIPFSCFYTFSANHTAPGVRFRNALFVLLLGMIILMGQSSSSWLLSEQSIRQLAHFFRSYALVACWCVIVSTSWVNKEKAVKIFGINIVIFSITSVAWMFVFSHSNGIAPIFIGLLLYVSFLAVNKFFPSGQTIQGNDWQQAKDECLHAIAAEHNLSSRETDIFMLLARGRSRHAIAETLYLSDGTVKGYASRIYRKLEVSSKDELLEMIQRYEKRD